MQVAMLFARPGPVRRIATGVAIAIAAITAVVAAEAVHRDPVVTDDGVSHAAASDVSHRHAPLAEAAVIADVVAPQAVEAARAGFDRPRGMLPGADEPHATSSE